MNIVGCFNGTGVVFDATSSSRCFDVFVTQFLSSSMVEGVRLGCRQLCENHVNSTFYGMIIKRRLFPHQWLVVG